MRYAWVLLDTKCWDQYWIEKLVLPRSLHILHFTQKTHQKVQLLIHLLWGSCEIPVFILPIKTILSELFCLGQALDCEWRDLKLETNFVLRNFYYLWKNSYIWILESVIQNKLLLCSLTFFSNFVMLGKNKSSNSLCFWFQGLSIWKILFNIGAFTLKCFQFPFVNKVMAVMLS